jgi:ADP-heptose:LPS heptosyltransferase
VLFQLIASNLLLGKPLAAADPPRLVPGPAERAHADRVFAEHGLGARPVAIVNLRAPKYAHMGRWGTDRFARVAEELLARGVDLVFNGGLQEQADELDGLPPDVRREIRVIGDHTPLELAAVIQRCDVFIGEPSGPTFLALAVGTPAVTLQGPGDHAYPGQNRGGAVWWPHRRQHGVVSKVEWCQLTMGASCRCTHTTAAPAPERALKYVGVWKTYKRLRRAVRPQAPRPPASAPRFPCLEAIEPADVVAAAMDLLGDRSRPAAPDDPVATR